MGWFTQSQPNAVGRVSRGGHITLFPIHTTASFLSGIVVKGHDVWFGEWSEDKTSRIARMSTGAKHFREFDVPPSIHGSDYFTNPHYLIVGPDHNIWFTAGEDGLGRITASGKISVFYLPQEPIVASRPDYGEPYGLTVGPDHAIWIAEQVGAPLVRFDLATHSFKTFPFDGSTGNFSADTVASGPDGALWITDFASDRIARVTSTGHYSVTPFQGAPFGIAGDRAGVWITRFGGNEISFIRPDDPAHPHDFAVPTAKSGPQNIAVQQCGKVFFNEQDAHRVGRISTSCGAAP